MRSTVLAASSRVESRQPQVRFQQPQLHFHSFTDKHLDHQETSAQEQRGAQSQRKMGVCECPLARMGRLQLVCGAGTRSGITW